MRRFPRLRVQTFINLHYRPNCRFLSIGSLCAPRLRDRPITGMHRPVPGVSTQGALVAQRHDVLAQIALVPSRCDIRIFARWRCKRRQQSCKALRSRRGLSLSGLLHAMEHTPSCAGRSENPPIEDLFCSRIRRDRLPFPFRLVPDTLP